MLPVACDCMASHLINVITDNAPGAVCAMIREEWNRSQVYRDYRDVGDRMGDLSDYLTGRINLLMGFFFLGKQRYVLVCVVV